MEGVVWAMRSGSPWRLASSEYGNWNRIYKGFARWCDNGVWTQMLAYFADDPDLANLMIDSPIVGAPPCAAGAPARRGGPASQALGRSRGGFTTHIQRSVAAHGKALRIQLTAGQRQALTHAPDLTAGFD